MCHSEYAGVLKSTHEELQLGGNATTFHADLTTHWCWLSSKDSLQLVCFRGWGGGFCLRQSWAASPLSSPDEPLGPGPGLLVLGPL